MEEQGGGLSFSYKNAERIYISFQNGANSYVDIDLGMGDLKPTENSTLSDIPAEFVFVRAQFYVLKKGQSP